jgi:phage terminase large subunit GpA-like protein
MLTGEIAKLLPSGKSTYLAGFARGIQPEADLKVSEWAEKKRVVAQGTSARPGPWRNDTAPYLAEIMDCLSVSHPCSEVAIKKSSQLGVTEVAINWLGYIADIAPSDVGYYMPNDGIAKTVLRTKIGPAIKSTPAMKNAIRQQVSRDEEGSSTFSKVLRGGGHIQFLGANASANLQTFTFKYLVKDDIREWGYDVDGSGDPDPQVDGRSKSYADRGRKILNISVPGLKGACRISKKYEAGDQRRYYVACPSCDYKQTLDWPRLRFNKAYPHDAHYACAGCGVLIEHHHKRRMVEDAYRRQKSGEKGIGWVAENAGPGREPSFQINQLYSPFISWDDTVKEFIAAEGDTRKEKAFTQQVLGLEYEEKGDAPDDEKLWNRREKYRLRRIPPTALVLTGAADVQHNRLEFAVYAWDRHGTRWLIDYGILEGDPNEQRVWRMLLEVTQRRYEDAWGRMWPIDQFGVDSGYLSQKVYAFVRAHPLRENIKALDGKGGEGLPPLGSPSKVDVDAEGKKIGSVMLWPVGTWGMKTDLYAALRRLIDGPDTETGQYKPGTAHYPDVCDVHFFTQLTAEHFRLRERPNASAVPEWVKKKGQPNEQHDMAVYAAALYRWMADSATEEEWKSREVARLSAPERQQRDLAEYWGGVATAPPKPDEQLPALTREEEEVSNHNIDHLVGGSPDID